MELNFTLFKVNKRHFESGVATVWRVIEVKSAANSRHCPSPGNKGGNVSPPRHSHIAFLQTTMLSHPSLKATSPLPRIWPTRENHPPLPPSFGNTAIRGLWAKSLLKWKPAQTGRVQSQSIKRTTKQKYILHYL